MTSGAAEFGPGAPEEAFADAVRHLASTGNRPALRELFREDHPVYDGRATAGVARMRGWLLLQLGAIGVVPAELPFVLEELESGDDAYAVACAARALRSAAQPSPAIGRFLLQALRNTAPRERALWLADYGGSSPRGAATSPVAEILESFEVLAARGALRTSDAEELRRLRPLLPRAQAPRVAELLASAERAAGEEVEAGDCCFAGGGSGAPPHSVFGWRRPLAVRHVTFEDQDGTSHGFPDLFIGHPTVVVFFYTRCDNPRKCSLSVAKLARLQRAFAACGLGGQVHTAAITYDPAFDVHERLRQYGADRGLRFGRDAHLLRATGGAAAVRRHFGLGVNFAGPLVNRHRVELCVLDCRGRVAASFRRVSWDEEAVIAEARRVLDDSSGGASQVKEAGSTVVAAAAAVGVALVPKCPLCWAAYAGALGLSGLSAVPPTAVVPLLIAPLVMHAAWLWRRHRTWNDMTAAGLTSAGAALGMAMAAGHPVAPAPAAAALVLAGAVTARLGRRIDEGGRTDS